MMQNPRDPAAADDPAHERCPLASPRPADAVDAADSEDAEADEAETHAVDAADLPDEADLDEILQPCERKP